MTNDEADPAVTGSGNNPLGLGPDVYTTTTAADPEVTLVVRDGYAVSELPASGGIEPVMVVLAVLVIVATVLVVARAWRSS